MNWQILMNACYISGGGASEVPPLTPTEEAMAQLISSVAVEGIPGVQETEAVEVEEGNIF